MFVVYILLSERLNRYYIGYTNDMNLRLNQHNSKRVKSTKSGAPWIIVYTEKHSTSQKAYIRERKIKSYKKGEAFKKLINK